ncbi:tail tape measure protein [Limosilactobacillus reuteri]|nr:tape measure protein [Limosilactobacillus reuteri]PWT34772.1 tail tape measure protein [Limosilactobacillus reuteri]PWT54289.1 tail tape measure protein [Limosilactobacillus reuteri]PWT59069.1 tail tape measure protein [Limosilactobacillus reuteri]PWT63745.1 tail tape measure protein [Limosilactobacillus reuteri]PWT65843.1 tail tape measure protein [Limosilactobacillus reuteri]
MSQSMSVEAVLSAYDESFSATLDKALKSINNLGRETQSASQTVGAGGSSISSTFKSMAGAMGLVAIAGKAWGVVKDSMSGAINRFDTLNKYPVVMKALNYSTRDVAKSTAILSKGIDGLPTSLQDVTSVAQQLAPLTGSATKASKSAIALNNAFLASGASVADTSRGLQQYTQMLSTGKVDLMSYRTLMETMPIALRKVANSFGFTGKSAEQDLYKALQSGQITVDQLNDRFIKLNGGVNGFAQLAKKNSEGIGTSFANLKNAVVKNLANMMSAIDDGFKQAGFGSIAQVLDNMKDGINSAFQIIGPIVTNATTVILNFVKVVGGALKSAFSNDIFKAAIVGITGFITAAAGISKIVGFFGELQKGLTAIKVMASVANDVKLLEFALQNMANESKIAAAGMKILNMITGMNPWVILAAAIVAVVAALTYFFTQTKTGRALWQGFTTWLSGAWQSLVGVATTVWNAIGNAINAVVDFIKPYWQGLVTFFTGIWTSIVAGVTPIWQGLVNVFSSIIDAIVAVWQALAPIIVPIVVGLVTVIGATLITIVTVFQTVWNMLVPIVQVVWQLISIVVSTAITMLSTVIQTGLAIIVAIWNAVWNTFSIVVSTVWNVITTIISTVLNVIAGIIQAITAAIQGNWSGAWNAIQNVVSTVLNAISSIVSSVLSGVAGIFSSVMNGLKNVVSSVWNGIKSLFSAGVNFIKSVVHIDLGAAGRAIMNSFLNGLKSVWENVKSFVSGIAGWIKAHKGPISYDRKLLIPAGQAIMNGLNNGLINGFSKVQSNVSDMANQIQQAITTPGFDIGASIGNLGSINSNYTGSLAIQDSQLQMQNNALLRQLLNKDTTMVLDDGTLVGYTADQYDYRLGQNTALKDRWSR